MKTTATFLISILLVLCLFGCSQAQKAPTNNPSNTTETNKVEQVSVTVFCLSDGIFLNNETTITVNKGDKYSVSEYVPETISFGTRSYALQSCHGELEGIANKDTVIISNYKRLQHQKDFALLGVWKLSNSEQCYILDEYGNASVGYLAGTMLPGQFWLNDTSSTIYIGYNQSLADDNNFCIEEYSYKLKDANTLELTKGSTTLTLTRVTDTSVLNSAK